MLIDLTVRSDELGLGLGDRAVCDGCWGLGFWTVGREGEREDRGRVRERFMVVISRKKRFPEGEIRE